MRRTRNPLPMGNPAEPHPPSPAPPPPRAPAQPRPLPQSSLHSLAGFRERSLLLPKRLYNCASVPERGVAGLLRPCDTAGRHFAANDLKDLADFAIELGDPRGVRQPRFRGHCLEDAPHLTQFVHACAFVGGCCALWAFQHMPTLWRHRVPDDS